jgi:hypothetical protein
MVVVAGHRADRRGDAGRLSRRDVWDDLIADWIEFRAAKDPQTKRPHPFTTKQVLLGLGYALSPEGEKVHVAGRAEEMRAARCLQKLGYRKDRNKRTCKVAATGFGPCRGNQLILLIMGGDHEQFRSFKTCF